jgi:hypothetical protein
MPSKKTKATEIAVEPPAGTEAMEGTTEAKEAALDKPTSPTESKKPVRHAEGSAFKAEELGTFYPIGL